MIEVRPYTEEVDRERQARIDTLLGYTASLGSSVHHSDDWRVKLTGIFNPEEKYVNTQDSEVASVIYIRENGFRDHNFIDPYDRLLSRFALSNGEAISIWNMGPRNAYLDAFHTRTLTAEDKNDIFQERLLSIPPKVFNHLLTTGAFIGGVEMERRQRMHNGIFARQLESGATIPATSTQLTELVETLPPLAIEE